MRSLESRLEALEAAAERVTAGETSFACGASWFTARRGRGVAPSARGRTESWAMSKRTPPGLSPFPCAVRYSGKCRSVH